MDTRPFSYNYTRLKIWRGVLLLSAFVFLCNASAHGLAFNRSAIDTRSPIGHGIPLGTVLKVSVLSLPALLNVVSIKKSANHFYFIQGVADNRVAYESYNAVNPRPGPGISKPGHHQLAFLYLDLPPPFAILD